jgi:hypothetical protein
MSTNFPKEVCWLGSDAVLRISGPRIRFSLGLFRSIFLIVEKALTQVVFESYESLLSAYLLTTSLCTSPVPRLERRY